MPARPQLLRRHARWLAAFPLILCGVAGADVKLASPFGPHMVLQRDKPMSIWGTADAGADVAVTVGSSHATAKADDAGKWSATLDPLPAGGPFALTATAGGATATADDVLLGDVYLCSGQSNMQYGMGEVADGGAIFAAQHPKLRLGKVGLAWVKEPASKCDCKWTAANPESAKSFAAVAYCFAHELYQQDPKLAEVPIGLLEDCMGATVIESWMPAATLAGYDKKTIQSSMFGIGPSTLYNGMIAPLKNLSLKGAIWYQGEGNAGQPARYAEYLPVMMKSWRDQLAQPELPFMIVQLPDYAPEWGGVYWQWMREAQAKAVAATPHASYVCTINTNDGWNLHPQGKHEIGRRLAMLARETIYGESIAGRSPAMREAKVDGAAVHVTFDTGGSALTSGTQPVEGFALAGEDGQYHAAKALIDGPDSVVVTSDAVSTPKTVRYAWAGVPRTTLTSAAGLPAAPFRTDDQPVSKGHGEPQIAPAGFAFKGPNYQLAIDGNGRATSLIVKGQQLLSNAGDKWGGTSVAVGGNMHNLPNGSTDGLDRMVFTGDKFTEAIAVADGAIHWTITNGGPKETLTFRVAVSPFVKVNKESDDKTATLKRRAATVTVVGIDAITTPKDPAADPGTQMLELSVPPNGSRTVDMTIGE